MRGEENASAEKCSDRRSVNIQCFGASSLLLMLLLLFLKTFPTKRNNDIYSITLLNVWSMLVL
jgi:hypothetical protein